MRFETGIQLRIGLILYAVIRLILVGSPFPNQKMGGYSHYIHASIKSVFMACQVSYYYGTQNPHLGKTDDCYSVLVGCIASSSPMKIDQ